MGLACETGFSEGYCGVNKIVAFCCSISALGLVIEDLNMYEKQKKKKKKKKRTTQWFFEGVFFSALGFRTGFRLYVYKVRNAKTFFGRMMMIPFLCLLVRLCTLEEDDSLDGFKFQSTDLV
jgi:hypothetical protein